MESGKTRAMIATLYELVNKQGFPPDRVYANCWLALRGSHWLRNDELRKVLRRAFNTETGGGRWNKCIFMIMEADDLYSHITQSDKECFFDIRKASQAYKRNQYLLYEVHEGAGVPKYMRDKTEISIKPFPNEYLDRLDLLVCDGHYDKTYMLPVTGISSVNKLYRRFDELH